MVAAQLERAPPLPAQARAVAFDQLSAASRLRAAAVGSALGPAIAPPPIPLSSDPTATVGRRQVEASRGAAGGSTAAWAGLVGALGGVATTLQRAFVLAG
jgi:hypothetical protein